jgi:hypothetical protein
MLRVVPVAFLAFGLGSLLLHYFMKSLRESDEPQNKDSVTVSGTRFFILVITLFAMGALFLYFSYE